MNAILGFVQLMKRDKGLDGEQRENVNIIERSGEHLLALINDVLSISKIEAGHVALNEHPFDLARLLDGLRETFRLKAESKGLDFEVDVGSSLPRTVRGDEAKVRQVLINLLGNAFKFTESGGVVLRASWREGRAAFEVEDTGRGIAPEEVGRLFGAFVQTESGRQSQEGTGLGLAISRSFARLMKGDITVTSEPGQGTVFRVEIALPATDASLPESNPRPVIGLEPGQPLYRILVVDDTLENRRLLVKLLTSIGFQVREASNGREAVEQWARWRPHLIWMDIRMPVMDGVEATREIRRREVASGQWPVVSEEESSSSQPQSSSTDHGPRTTDHCKIIALTASVFDTEHGAVLAAGCDALVTKPFKEVTIFDTLVEHLGVRFVYERTGRTGPLRPLPGAQRALTPARLAALPADLLSDLTRAVHVGDVEVIHMTINRICDCDEPLGNELRDLARRYQFEEILETVDRV
jgi:CheY-like chemotaxis protein